MMLPSPIALLLAAGIITPAQSLSIKPSPPATEPPKSLSSRRTTNTVRPAWGGNNRGGRQKHQPLRAYTVADNNKPSWMSLLRLPTSFADLASQFGNMEESLFSFEGGGVAEAAKMPYMPNLEVEAATISAANIDLEKDELLSELNALTATFAELESSMDYKSQLYEATIESYEAKVIGLEAKNVVLAKGVETLTLTLEKQEKQLQELQQETKKGAMEDGNELLRQRVRGLELELSEVAFESRKLISPDTSAKVATLALAGTSDMDAESPLEPEVENGVDNVEAFVPKAPNSPPPQHILQQRQLGELQLQVEQYERERSSVRKLFGLGLRRGVNKVGRALNVWNPVHNLMLWGEMRRQIA